MSLEWCSFVEDSGNEIEEENIKRFHRCCKKFPSWIGDLYLPNMVVLQLKSYVNCRSSRSLGKLSSLSKG